ncbi:MAG: ribosome silencing factor [Isosphaera sp.]|nr:ribosome silencing factor [Isosphaera sp.]
MSKGAAKKRTKKAGTKAPAAARAKAPKVAPATPATPPAPATPARSGARATSGAPKAKPAGAKPAKTKPNAAAKSSGKSKAKPAATKAKPAAAKTPASATPRSKTKPTSPPAVTVRERQEAAARALAVAAAWSLHADKCQDVRVLDVRGLSSVADYYVLASGTSDRQMRGASDNAAELAGRLGHEVVRQDIDDRTTWVVLDCVDVLVHVFEPATRAHYDLETMWGDAKAVDWRAEPGAAPGGPGRGIRARRVVEPAHEGAPGEA